MMTLPDRINIILSENQLKQKELAAMLSVSPSYISGLISGRNKTVSSSLAAVIEQRLGYSADWVLYEQGPKMRTHSKNPSLSAAHQRAILQIEGMTDAQARAVLAFVRSLNEVEDILRED